MTFKVCEECKKSLASDLFATFFDKRYKRYLRKRCKACDYLLSKKRHAKSRLAKKLKALAYLGGKCARCGYDRNPYVLDFNHKDPKRKLFSMTRLIEKRGWGEIVKELEKCEILCANCHREETFKAYYFLRQ